MTRLYLLSFLLIPLIELATGAYAVQPELRFKEAFLKGLVASVPDILKTQDPATGRFGTGIWICTDQNVMFPLAAAWAIKSPENPYYHDPKLLTTIIAAGDALIEDADEHGQWVFRKKDGSTWGMTSMPWTYTRWIRSYDMIKDGMPDDARKRWEKALTLGYTWISTHELPRVHNIPTYHAMGLYIAGQTLGHPEWCKQAKEFMAKVVAAQDPGGFWSENHGPVVMYGSVYTDAIGTYYAISHDTTVLPALERAARFYANFNYPDGSAVETVDERNPFHGGIWFPNAAFTLTPEGRGFILRQMDLLAKTGKSISPDFDATYLLYGQEGPAVDPASQDDHTFVLDDRKALTRRDAPWFVCMSAFHCPIPTSRWIQDRQNLVSIFHDKCGLIIGGGNTKLQPLWSNFTVGDVSLLKHKPGDTAPKFIPDGPLFHVPSAASIEPGDAPRLCLQYGEELCWMDVRPLDDHQMQIRVSATTKSGLPVAAHIVLMPHIGEAVRGEHMPERKLGDEVFTLTSKETGGWIEHHGWRLSIPEGARIDWPVLPHNPYRKDGSATTHEGRLVVTLPFSPEMGERVLMLSVGD